MKIAAASDIHGFLWDEIPECDVMFLAGDLMPFIGHHSKKARLKWLDEDFRQWLLHVGYSSPKGVPVIGCAGNHDWPFYEYPEEVAALKLPWTYLQDSHTMFQGLKVYGTPWQRVFYDWAFNLQEHQLAGKWNLIPDDTDILLCHSPPKFYGDLTRDGRHEGSESLTWRIKQIEPKLVIFGHIHNGRGEARDNKTLYTNVSFLDESYHPVHGFWTMEMDFDEKKEED